MSWNIRVIQILVFLFCFARLFSQETLLRPFVGIGGGHMLLAGSFNGSDYFQTDEDILLVPKISPAFGYGGVAGFSLGNGAFEVGYYHYESEYTSLDADYTGRCVSHLIRFLGISKYLDAYAQGRFNPYFDFETSVAYTILDKIAYPTGQSDNPSPARYSGFIFGLGGGCRAWISDGFAFDFRVLPEYYMGADIRVQDRDRYEITKFGNFLLHTTLSLKYYFKASKL